LKVPVTLGHDDAEAVERRRGRPDRVAEHVAVLADGDQHHVVDRRDGPDHQQDGEHARHRLAEHPPQPIARTPGRSRDGDGGAHSCTSEVRSLCISSMTIGISTGSADITAATPSRGWASTKASRMPSVASTSVDIAGPPPETKYTVLKSPKVQMVESKVQTR